MSHMLGARKLMSGRLVFMTSVGHGLAPSSDQIALGHPVALGFSLLPATHLAGVCAALPSRYSITAQDRTRWQGRAAAELEKEALGFSPVFKLSRNCSNGLPVPCLEQSAMPAALPLGGSSISSNRRGTGSSTRVSAASFASLAAVEADATEPQAAPKHSSSTAVALQQLGQQYVQQQQQQHQQQHQQLPWLGAELDMAGYTKKGYINGGSKEQNQDRGLIMQQFRSPAETLLGVMDGHGANGHLVSTFLVQHLPAVLMQKLVAAAAALVQSSSSSGDLRQQSFKQPQKHKRQQHDAHQMQPECYDSQLPFVVIPDHHSSAPGVSSSTASAALAGLQQQQQQSTTKTSLRHGKVVNRNKVVPKPEHVPNSSSSSSSGDDTSDAIAVPRALVDQVPLSSSLMTAAFGDTDRMLIGSGVNTLDSGSTAILCHVGPDSITAAWVGDSRAVLGRKVEEVDLRMGWRQRQQQQLQGGNGSSNSCKWQAIELSSDHKPERPDEQLRIILNNGRVQQMKNKWGQGVGPFRVWFKQMDYPGLAMSRAFGDTPCRRIGVTVDPELYVHRLTDADQLLVCASDGVWEYISSQEAIELASGAATAELAARRLVEAAEQRWRAVDGGSYVDDITAVVVRATPRRIASKL